MATVLEILIRARDEFSAELKSIQESVSSSSRDINRVGLAMGAVGAAGLAGFGLATKSAIDFESSFAGVRKTVDASEEEFAALEEGFRSLARQTPINVNEINRIGEAAGQLGIKVENIEGFTKVMADLGVATNLSSDEAATALARLANITQLPQTEFDRLGSTVVELGNNLATTESEIVEMGLRLAGAGKQIGLTEDEILALGGALSSVGIEAEAGGTAFSRVMIDIAQAVDQGGDKLDEFARVAGLSVEEFRELFERDAAEAIVTFVEGLGRIKDEGGSTFQVLEDLGQGNIRVRDALLRASGAGDLMRESLQLGSQAWQENTALTEEAEKRYGTMASQIEILKNNINDIAIDIGQVLLPVLGESVEGAQAALDVWREIPEPLRDAGVRFGLVASGMLAVSGGFLIMLPRVLEGVTAFQRLRTQSGLLGGAMRALPLALVGVAAAAILIPPLFSEGEQKARAYAGALKELGDASGETGAVFETKALRFLNETSTEIENLTEKVENAGFLIPQKLVPGPIRKFSEDVTDALERVGESLTGIPAKIDTVADVQDVLRGRLEAFVESARQAGISYPEAMRLVEQSSLNTSDAVVKEALEPMRLAYLDSLADVKDVWGPGVAEAMRGVQEEARIVMPDMGELMTGFRTATEESMAGAETAIQGVLPTMDEEFAEWEKRLDEMAVAYSGFQTNLETILGELVDANVENPEKIILALEAAGPEVTAVMARQLAENPVAAVQGVLADLGTITNTNIQGMTNAVLQQAPNFQRVLANEVKIPIESIPLLRQTEFSAFVGTNYDLAVQRALALARSVPTEVRTTFTGDFAQFVGTNFALARRQHGGPLRAFEAAFVGETGPELFVSPVPGTIISNQALGGVTGREVGVPLDRVSGVGGGGGQTVIHMNARALGHFDRRDARLIASEIAEEQDRRQRMGF